MEVSRYIDGPLHKAAEEVANAYCGVDASPALFARFHEAVEDLAYDALLEALNGLRLPNFTEWLADGELSEAADRERERTF